MADILDNVTLFNEKVFKQWFKQLREGQGRAFILIAVPQFVDVSAPIGAEQLMVMRTTDMNAEQLAKCFEQLALALKQQQVVVVKK